MFFLKILKIEHKKSRLKISFKTAFEKINALSNVKIP